MIIRVKNLSTSYANNVVLNDISLQINKNKITAIIGPSGCGKTTLLMTLAGLVKHIPNYKMQGEIEYQNEIYTQKNIGNLIGKTGFVFQQPLAFPISIMKNLTFATRYRGINKSDREAIAITKLKEVNLYEEVKDDLNLKASKLSGGQQQRLCIARALTTNPNVLLLDEPCSALDVKNTTIIENLLSELKQRYTVILVTHNLAQAKRISDEIVFINEGTLIETGLTDVIFNEPLNSETKNYISGSFG